MLAGLISKHKIDIVHAHHKDNLPLVALAKSLCDRRFKLVFTRQMPMKHEKKDPYHRWIYRQINLFITITELLKRDAIEKLPIRAEQITRLYYGVKPPPPRDEAFLKGFLNLSQPGDFNIGVFSRLEFQKGQHLVIDAAALLARKGIPVKLYIVGDVMYADYKESLEEQVRRLSLEDRVVFKGFIPKPALAMIGMDVLLLPSRNEAFGLVLIEAMRCGVTVMGVNAGGVPEIIDHEKTGLLFEWNEPQKLADQLLYLYENPEVRREIAQRGKEKADREFDSEVHFQRLETLLAGLLV